MHAICTARSRSLITTDSNLHNSFLVGKKMPQLKILEWKSFGKNLDFCCSFRFAPWIFWEGNFWTFLSYTFWKIELKKYVLGIKAFHFKNFFSFAPPCSHLPLFGIVPTHPNSHFKLLKCLQVLAHKRLESQGFKLWL
jgi:hypothetical protein